MWDWKQ